MSTRDTCAHARESPRTLLQPRLVLDDHAAATPFTIYSELTGDFRAGNPDGLLVNVTITGDTTSNMTNRLVNLDIAANHPSARLGVFAFNVATEWFQYVVFSNFSPSDWVMTSGTDVPYSSGAPEFLDEVAEERGLGANAIWST